MTATSPPPDHYRVLGVPPDASQEQIRDAFIRGCKEVHPDGDPTDPSRHWRFQLLAEAYGVLGRPNTRLAYDRQLRTHRTQCPPHNRPPPWETPPRTHGTATHSATHSETHSGTHGWKRGDGATERSDPTSRYWSQFRPPGPPHPGAPPRRRVLLLCLLLAAGGAAAHAMAYRLVAGAHSSFMDKKDQELQAAYDRSRARAGSSQEVLQRLREARQRGKKGGNKR